jgi:hypothetical protein
MRQTAQVLKGLAKLEIEEKTLDETLLAPCSVYCSLCIVYKTTKCLGCAKQSKTAEAKGKVFCDIYTCARGKNLAACSDCGSYPCDKYDDGIFAESYIQWVREMLKEA